MISHVIEYACQYSDQVRKKHKTWHDGKMKFFEANKRFLLYPEDSNVLLSSNFVTNSREIASILDPEGFDTVEHSIFGRFVVIITDKLTEYEREVQTQKAGNSNTKVNVTSTGILAVKKSNEVDRSSMDKLPNKKVIIRKRKLIKEEPSTSSSEPTLALKFNKPFKPPRMIKTEPIVNEMNRIGTRNSKIQRQPTMIDEDKNIPRMPLKFQTRKEETYKISQQTVVENELSHPKNKVTKNKPDKKLKARIRKNLKISKISHNPIIL